MRMRDPPSAFGIGRKTPPILFAKKVEIYLTSQSLQLGIDSCRRNLYCSDFSHNTFDIER